MDTAGLQTTLTVVVILTGAMVVAFFEYRRKQCQQQQTQSIKTWNADSPRPSLGVYDAAALEYASGKELAAERPLEPRVVTPTVSSPPTPPAVARETVTITVTGSAGGASSLFASSSVPEFTSDAALWERLIASMPRHDLLTQGDPAPKAEPEREQVIQSEPQSAWPTGMVQPPAFQQLLDGKERFSGLVVSVGINDADSSMWHRQGLMQSISGYIAELLHEHDFSCRTAYDEFVLVCRGELGAQSQRRLNHISEQLWDFQLRGMNTCAILFSWGGVQVQNQPLAEAVASAVDRMRQTKRVPSPTRLARAHGAAV
jgi:hypothetical protein